MEFRGDSLSLNTAAGWPGQPPLPLPRLSPSLRRPPARPSAEIQGSLQGPPGPKSVEVDVGVASGLRTGNGGPGSVDQVARKPLGALRCSGRGGVGRGWRGPCSGTASGPGWAAGLGADCLPSNPDGLFSCETRNLDGPASPALARGEHAVHFAGCLRPGPGTRVHVPRAADLRSARPPPPQPRRGAPGSQVAETCPLRWGGEEAEERGPHDRRGPGDPAVRPCQAQTWGCTPMELRPTSLWKPLLHGRPGALGRLPLGRLPLGRSRRHNG